MQAFMRFHSALTSEIYGQPYPRCMLRKSKITLLLSGLYKNKEMVSRCVSDGLCYVEMCMCLTHQPFIPPSHTLSPYLQMVRGELGTTTQQP